MKLSDVKEGMVVLVDGGFTCMQAGRKMVFKDEKGFYVYCSEGHHYLDGQEDKPGADLVGIKPDAVTEAMATGKGYHRRSKT